MKNIIVFGGSGFIGRYLIQILNSDDTFGRIINLDIHRPALLCEKEEFHNCDVRNKISNLDDKIKSVHCIVNLAAIHKNPGHEPHEYYEANVNGAENIIDFANKLQCQHVIFISSIAVYGPDESLKDEKSSTTPVTDYGKSKLLAEEKFQAWQKNYQENVLLTLRPGIVFGLGENGNFDRLLKLMKCGFFPFLGRTDTIKSCIYVKDLAHLIADSIKINLVGTFNTVYFNNKNIKEICLAMKKHMSLDTKLIFIPDFFVKIILNSLLALGKMLKMSFLENLVLRAKKLIQSTNISSQKLQNQNYKFKYGFENALIDWHKENIANKP